MKVVCLRCARRRRDMKRAAVRGSIFGLDVESGALWQQRREPLTFTAPMIADAIAHAFPGMCPWREDGT